MLCRRLSPALLLSKREMLNPNAWALFRHERFYSFLGSFAGPSAHSPASSSCFGAPNFGGHQGRSMSSASSSRVGGVDASRFVEIASGINEDQPSLLVLHDMQNNKGAHKKKRRIGRGNGSSKGHTAGKGFNGQLQRPGGMHGKILFEGGQTHIVKATPKVGFKNGYFRQPLNVVNIDKIVQWIQNGRIDASQPITLKVLKDSGIFGNSPIKFGVKLLSKGHSLLSQLQQPLRLEVSYSSKVAKDAVETAGGTVSHVYFNRNGLRGHLKPHKFGGLDKPMLPRAPGLPPPKKRWRYPHLFDENPEAPTRFSPRFERPLTWLQKQRRENPKPKPHALPRPAPPVATYKDARTKIDLPRRTARHGKLS